MLHEFAEKFFFQFEKAISLERLETEFWDTTYRLNYRLFLRDPATKSVANLLCFIIFLSNGFQIISSWSVQ